MTALERKERNMSNETNTPAAAPEQDLSELLQIRRDKLKALQDEGRNPFEQTRIVKEVMAARRYNKELERMVKGFMIESYIEDGNQAIDGGCYGKSITDPCLGWEKTERLILDLADMV